MNHIKTHLLFYLIIVLLAGAVALLCTSKPEPLRHYEVVQSLNPKIVWITKGDPVFSGPAVTFTELTSGVTYGIYGYIFYNVLSDAEVARIVAAQSAPPAPAPSTNATAYPPGPMPSNLPKKK